MWEVIMTWSWWLLTSHVPARGTPLGTPFQLHDQTFAKQLRNVEAVKCPDAIGQPTHPRAAPRRPVDHPWTQSPGLEPARVRHSGGQQQLT